MNDNKEINDLITLDGSNPIAHGAVRDIWNRPEHPDQIIKTIRMHKRKKYEDRSGPRRVIDDLRLGPYRTFWIEYRCYLKTAFKCVQLQKSLPIAEIGGIVLTDRGLGQVCEKITNSSGDLAQTLKAIAENDNLDGERLVWLNEFTRNIYALNVNVPDLTATNIVLDEAKKRFVLIDGYGDKTVFPIRSSIKFLNQKQIDVRFSDMQKFCNLRWCANTKCFLR
jgi:hypothetical protein